MKKKELKEIRKMSIRDLNKELSSERSRLDELKFSLPLGKVDNVSEIRSIKKNIAQILTIIKEKTNK